MPQRRYSDTEIDNFIKTLPVRKTKPKDKTVSKLEEEPSGPYLRLRTHEFMLAHPQHLPADLSYFREKLSNHGAGPKPTPAVMTKALDLTFDAHVQGDMAGVGWHTEIRHRNGSTTHSYEDVVALSGKSFWASNVKINGTAKSGNKGRSTFFTSDISLAFIREDALYVAHCGTPLASNKSLIIGRGKKTGVYMECLMNEDTIISAYPYYDFKSLG